jgi:hypothetical protein
MLRSIAILALMLASPSFAQTDRADPAPTPRDRFVIAPDTCGASRYAHLVGESYTAQQASLPQHALVHGAGPQGPIPVGGATHAGPLLTLEYEPQRLNVVVGADQRIVSIGCH